MVGLAQSGLQASGDFSKKQTDDGRQRGLGERSLSAAGNLAGGLAYQGYRGGTPGGNALTHMIGTGVGGHAVGSASSAAGRGLDAAASKIRARKDRKKQEEA